MDFNQSISYYFKDTNNLQLVTNEKGDKRDKSIHVKDYNYKTT